MALNRYLARTHELIDQYKGNAPFAQFKNLDGQFATFDDLVWFYIDPKTKKTTRVTTGRHGVKGYGSAGSDPRYALREPYGDLIKVFAIETFNTTVSAGEKRARIASARRLLTHMKGELHTQTASTIIECSGGHSSQQRTIPFLLFCEKNGLMPRAADQVRRKIKDRRDRTGHNAEASRTEKLPNEEVIKAVGNIYGKTLSGLLNGNAEQGYFRDTLASFFTLLSLASPNRVAAEIPLLDNQELQKYSEGDRADVYYLDWHGSKGYQDNKNHVLSALSDPIEKGLNFFSKACLPGRIIAAYYINPNQKLGQLLGDFPTDPERQARLDMSRKPHLFTLGYALGFYDVDAEVEVFIPGADDLRPERVRNTQRRHAGRKNCWQAKRIYELQIKDEISTSTNRKSPRQSVAKLSGTAFDFRSRESLNLNGTGLISIGQFESLLVNLHHKAFPSFPIGFSKSDVNSVRMDAALFCVLGHQFYGKFCIKKGGLLGGTGFYSILTPNSLASILSLDLSKMGKLFLRHGFPAHYFLNFHQLRHYTNTIADQSGIPNEVVTAWSGRRSREQTYEYIHTSHAERSARVSDVQIKTNDMTKPIRWVSSKEIVQEFNLPASVTSTGVCTQNLVVSPCEFLNDFISSCFTCPSACYIAGDSDAIAMLEKDSQFQQRRIEVVKTDDRLKVSQTMQDWFILHNRNTQVLVQLVQLMKDEPKGTVISFNDKAHQFNLVDAKTKKLTHVMAKLTDSHGELKKALEQQKKSTAEPSSSDGLAKLMAKYSLVETA